jgi:hypothetical protein
VPSDSPPCGTGGKKLIIYPEAAQKAIDTIVNMPLNCEFGGDFWGSYPEYAMTGHNTRFIVGEITKGTVDGDVLVGSGIIWKQNHPDVAYMVNNAVDALGFSIEANINGSTEDETTVTATDITFTGAAILWKKCAAFESTEFKQLVASKFKKTKEIDKDMELTKEELQAMLEGIIGSVKAEVEAIKTEVSTVVAEVKAEIDKANAQVEQLAVTVGETKVAIEAAKAEPVVEPVAEPVVSPPAPTVVAAGATVVPNGDFTNGKQTKAQRIAEVHASNRTTLEKLREIVRINSETEEVAK